MTFCLADNCYVVTLCVNQSGANFWNTGAQNRLLQQLSEQPIKTQAKNVIMFLGDGMSIPTLAAARIYKGQLEGLDGEEQELSFEKFPYTGLSKVWRAK